MGILLELRDFSAVSSANLQYLPAPRANMSKFQERRAYEISADAFEGSA